MRCSLRIFVLVLCLVFAAHGQKRWFWRNPAPQSNGLTSVQFCSNQLAYAVGKMGMILRSNNGGSLWSIASGNVDEALNDVHFFNADSGLAVGANGVILRTRDGANEWTRLLSPTAATLHAIFAYDYNAIVVVGSGGVILHSIDGGDHWELCDSKTTEDLYAVAANALGFVFAVGKNGVMVRSRDGGDTWELRANIGGATLHSLVFGSDKLGVAVGENGKIYRSVTGDSIWLPITQVITGNHLRRIRLLDETQAFIVGDNGVLLKSTDAGASWSAGSSSTTKSLYDIDLNGSNGLMVGADGAIMMSTDGGTVWQGQFASATTAKLRGISMASQLICTVVGDSSGKGMILRSYDGGISWLVQNRTPNCIFEEVFFTHADSGFVVGSAGNVWRTVNGGTTWNKVTNIPADYQFKNLYGIHFPTARIGAIVGSSGAIWRTVDGGQSWSSQTNPFSMAPLLSVHFTHPDSGIAVGYFGAVLRTTDGGANWIKLTGVPVSTNIILTSVAFADADTGIVVGQTGTVLRTTDGGATWQLMTLHGLDGMPMLEYVYFVDNMIGYIVGADGHVFRSEDGGFSWQKQLRTTSASLNAVYFLDPYVGMAAGDQGTILRTYDGGLPVELAAFSGWYDVSRRAVILNWQTATETNNYGFEVQKRFAADWEKIGFVQGHGTSTESHDYTFQDLHLATGYNPVRYRLKQIDLDGAFSYSPVIQIRTGQVMDTYTLEQNYPNPFNYHTTIGFSLPTATSARLQIFNALGQRLETLVDGDLTAGRHHVVWRAAGRAGGVYFVRLSAAGVRLTRKILYLP